MTLCTATLLAIENSHRVPTQIDEIWRLYRPRVVGLARRLLRTSNSCVLDEEDIAQWVFHSFSRGLLQGRYGTITNAEAIWYLLARITRRRVIDHLRYEKRVRRSQDHLKREDAFPLSEVAATGPSPESTLMAKETFDRIMNTLGDERLCEVAVGKINGLTHVELAQQLQCSTRTIERRLAEVRCRLTEECGLSAS